ncbi:MAG: hypothetical protein H6844_00950 [Alphaproteobacteria bacterium]|nr:hypothetical protein [Alphaproteobacteria bacterium]
MADLIALVWKAGIASGVLMLVVLAGQRAGPVLASIAMTYPFNSGVGFALMMWERSDAFMAEAGVAAFALAGGVFAFMTGYARAAPLGGFFRPWCVGIAAWLAVAAVSVALPMTWPLAVALAAAGVLAAALLMRRPAAPPVPPGKGAGTWRATIARAVLGGTVIGAVAVYSKLLGPLVSGMALAFPIMMSASLWILHRRFGEAFAVETIYRSRWALASYSSFVFCVGLLSDQIGGIAAVLVGASVAALASFAVYRIGRSRA